MRCLCGLAAALTVVSGLAAAARADDAASLRQELDTLNSQIERIDANITDTAKGNAALKSESDAYAAKAKADAASGDALKQRSQQLTARRKQLDDEHAAAEQTCHKTTATPQEYQAALAACEKASQAYSRDADAYRADQQRLADDLAAYHTATQDLQAEYKDIEQKRHDILAHQAALNETRQETLNRFNEIRDRLTALQPAPPPTPGAATAPK